MDKQFYLGFAVLEMRKLLMYENCYDKQQPYFEENKNLHCMDTDNVVWSKNTTNTFYKSLI